MLLNWYSYSITGFWNLLGKLFEKSFQFIIMKLEWLPNIFYVLLIAFLFVMWMVVMRKYYKDHKDKGIIE